MCMCGKQAGASVSASFMHMWERTRSPDIRSVCEAQERALDAHCNLRHTRARRTIDLEESTSMHTTCTIR